MTYTIAALYRFVSLPDPAALRDELLAHFREQAVDEARRPRESRKARELRHSEALHTAEANPAQHTNSAEISAESQTLSSEAEATEDSAKLELCGSLLLAPEGINGTLAGSAEAIDLLLTLLERQTGLPRADVKFSTADARPFGRLKLHVRRAIIPFRHADVDPNRPGTYVEPEHWNTLIADPDVLLLDTRNRYEVELGTFANAVDPAIDTFSEFATYVRENLDPAVTPKVAMFCTGGIRCEKASAFLLQEGFSEVYHLKGGILKYLEQTPEQESQWRGDCFVFDRRTSVSHTDFKP